MSTFFVSNSGSDANNGLGPDQSHGSNRPWATIGKALGAAGIASGDTVHIGPGTYRETVTVAMTSATVETFVLGDPWNAQGFKNGSGVLLTPTEVVWTAYTTNDTTTPATAATIILSGRDFLTFKFLTVIGGNASVSCISATTTNSVNITFRDCVFQPGTTSGSLINHTALADIATNWTIDRCTFIIPAGASGYTVTLPTSSVADYDSNTQIQNSLFIIGGNGNGVNVTASGALSFKSGGVDVLNSTFILGISAMKATNANLSTTIPCTIYNSYIFHPSGSAIVATTTGQLLEDYNIIVAGTPRGNVSAGANSQSGVTYAPLLEAGQFRYTGAQPRPFFSPMTGSPLLGFGDNGGAPATDILNRPRPAGGASISKAVGAFERHDTAAQETSVTQAGASAIKIVGPGDHQFQIPVDAASTTVSIYVRYDTNHGTSTKPQAILLANGAIGVAAETKTATVGVDTWEQLIFAAQTPSAKGVVTIRLVSRAAAGNGIAYFDTAAVA